MEIDLFLRGHSKWALDHSHLLVINLKILQIGSISQSETLNLIAKMLQSVQILSFLACRWCLIPSSKFECCLRNDSTSVWKGGCYVISQIKKQEAQFFSGLSFSSQLHRYLVKQKCYNNNVCYRLFRTKHFLCLWLL